MAEANWYYSHGEEQLGPVTAPQLKKLATGGKLSSTDLVWKEGMDDWVAASSIDGLFPIAPPPAAASQQSTPSDPPAAEPPAVEAPAITTEPRAAMSTPRGRGAGKKPGSVGAADLLGYTRYIAYPALVFGLLLAMMSRGCESLSSSDISAADARNQLARQQFDSETTRQRQALEDERDSARENDLNDRVTEINTELSKLADKRKKEKNDLERDEWRTLKEDADTAQLNHAIGAWWRELFFRFGTIVLTFGLLGVGLTGKGADRWVCLVILVIVIMNLYGSVLTLGLGGR